MRSGTGRTWRLVNRRLNLAIPEEGCAQLFGNSEELKFQLE